LEMLSHACGGLADAYTSRRNYVGESRQRGGRADVNV
jgi:hypothetical protein